MANDYDPDLDESNLTHGCITGCENEGYLPEKEAADLDPGDRIICRDGHIRTVQCVGHFTECVMVIADEMEYRFDHADHISIL